MIEPLRDAGWTVTVPTSREVGVAAGQFFDACSPDNSTLRHRDQAPLNASVAGASTRPLGDAWAWDKRKGVDITPLVAVTNAAWLHGETVRPGTTSVYEERGVVSL